MFKVLGRRRFCTRAIRFRSSLASSLTVAASPSVSPPCQTPMHMCCFSTTATGMMSGTGSGSGSRASSTSTKTKTKPNAILSAWDANVRTYAHQTAVIQDDHESTFQAMDLAVNNICLRLLREYKCKKGDRVMYLGMHFSIHAMQMYIACWKLGLVFVPTNALYTDDQLQRLEHSFEPLLVVIPQQYADKTVKNFTRMQSKTNRDEYEYEYIVIANRAANEDGEPHSDSSHLTLGQSRTTTAELQSELNDVIYDSDVASITCTSGTTGQPKGVMHSRAFMECADKVFGHPFLGEIAHRRESMLFTMKMFGAGSLMAAIVCIQTASTMILPNLERADEVSEWHALCWKHPSLKRVFLIGRGLMNVVDYGQKMPDSLETVMYGGDYLPFQTIFDAKQQQIFRSDLRFVHGYGQTEAGFVAFLDPQRVDNAYRKVIRDAQTQTQTQTQAQTGSGSVPGLCYNTNVILPVGNADSFWGMQIEIRSADGNGVGEICVRSPELGSMLGYWKNPEKTAETIDEHGWVKSGDIGKIDEENMLFCYGRSADLIVNAEGNYVLPILIENALVAHPSVSEIAVIGYKDDKDDHGDSGAIPVAFVSIKHVCASDDWDTIVQQLRELNQRLLPSDSQVIHFFQKDSLPKSLGNKIAKNVLKHELLSLKN